MQSSRDGERREYSSRGRSHFQGIRALPADGGRTGGKWNVANDEKRDGLGDFVIADYVINYNMV